MTPENQRTANKSTQKAPREPMRIAYTFGTRTVSTLGTPTETTRREALRYHPRRGWAVGVGRTGATRYISGLDALNLCEIEANQARGDWHREATWWSPTYVDRDGWPETVTLWGPDGEREAAPGSAALRDVRRALATLEHPDAKRNESIWAATMAQATVDLAWDALHQGGEPPSRREITSWLHSSDETEARTIAAAVATRIADPTTGAQWERWRAESLCVQATGQAAQGRDKSTQPARGAATGSVVQTGRQR